MPGIKLLGWSLDFSVASMPHFYIWEFHGQNGIEIRLAMNSLFSCTEGKLFFEKKKPT